MAFIAAAAPFFAIASSLVGAGGAIMQGVAANNAAKYQQQVAQMNAKIAQDNATRALERSQIEQQDQDMITRAELASQEAAQSASGLSLSGGSQMLTRKSAAMLGRRDALQVRQAGELEAYNFRTQAANAQAEGELARAKGRSSLIGSYLTAGGSLLSGASSFGEKYDAWRRKQ